MNVLDALFLVGQMPEDPQDTLDAGYEYFLGKEAVEELLKIADTKLSTPEAKVELAAHYAEYDAYPAWFNEVSSKRAGQ